MLTQNKKIAGAVMVGLSMIPQENMIQALTIIVMISILIIAMVGTSLSNVLIGWAFRPLYQIGSVASKIAVGDLSKRTPPAPTTTEVDSPSNSLNIMLSHLEQAFSTVELSERRMRCFVSDTSHELRTPIAATRGYAELYRMGEVEPEWQVGVMARIESEATRMGNMVQDLLTLAYLDEHRPMVLERTDLTVIVHNVLSDQTVTGPKHPVAPLNSGNESIEDVLPVYAVVDSEKAPRVIANLLSSVCQHIPLRTAVEIAVGYRTWPDEMGRNLRVSETSKTPAYQRCTVIEIRDHGLGVDPENAEEMLERFFRADASRVRTTGDTGLGLATISGIVSVHNGTVAMLTTPGGGTIVRIKLPCQVPYIPAESTIHTRSKPTPPPPSPPPPNT